MDEKKSYCIEVAVSSRFLDEQSAPSTQHFAFSYTIRISNVGSVGAKLLARHWVITDGNGKVREVRGSGVVGEQPQVKPGEVFEYTSGAVLETEVGMMTGSYVMLAEDGTQFEASIPSFVLSMPRTLH